ncbi:MFS transporter [Sphingomonas sp. PP-CC-3G-468]|uniref:MFS transporter n=1 Tax=Sphingomonas sp. PP-CC-3G-468 TaxID=2135656 RepID=UPI0010484389|nr:MFS transporter [Sphingomonas sp. PP-CC-3G-468]TCM07402.1 putative MFS family arabinose efflux permease [Sphingomonas sp. PP-CC-3G-468]
MASITASADVDSDATSSSPAAWGALYAMTLCTFVLVASEFMPISLLSPIAHDLHLTEGQAGQAISISGLFAMVASLSLSRVIGRRDRRHVLLALTALLVVSGSLVALAPNYALLMAGRALLGIAIGGFWSMSAAIAMRLVPPASVPKALAVLNGGSAIAAVVGAPAGSFLGGLIGWRGAFFCVVPLAVAAVIWQAVSLPRLPYRERTSGTGFMTLLRRRSVLIGLLGSALFFMGQYSLYTYLRPFLERVTGVGVGTLSSLLLLIGVSGFIGTMLVGRVIGRKLHLALAVFPAVLALVAVGLTMFGSSVAIVAALLALWGLFATSAPVGWWTWVTRAAPDDPEAGGGLVVAIVQFSIMAGAAGGGIIYDAFGPQTEFLASAAILLAAVPIALLSRTAPSAVS